MAAAITLDLPTPLAAICLGAVHAATPCAHSWPMLIPVVMRTRRAVVPGALFGAGMLISSVAAGAVTGAMSNLPFAGAGEIIERIAAVLLVVLGVVMTVRPHWMHAGHLHGTCLPAEAVADGRVHTANDGHGHGECGHTGHRPGRFQQFGPHAGVFLLGLTNMAVPCVANGSGILLAVHAGGALKGALVLGIFGAAAGLTMIVLLMLILRGLHIVERLWSPAFETTLMRTLGMLMLAYGIWLLAVPE